MTSNAILFWGKKLSNNNRSAYNEPLNLQHNNKQRVKKRARPSDVKKKQSDSLERWQWKSDKKTWKIQNISKDQIKSLLVVGIQPLCSGNFVITNHYKFIKCKIKRHMVKMRFFNKINHPAYHVSLLVQLTAVYKINRSANGTWYNTTQQGFIVNTVKSSNFT